MTASSTRFSRWEQQNIALAAVAQCAALVHRVATTGELPQAELRACINPLFVTDPDNFDEIYPHIGELTLGLRTVQAIFSNEKNPENNEIVRYTLGMLLLRNRLNADSAMQEQIRDRLSRISPLTAEDDEQDNAHPEAVIRQLASLYQDTISSLSYRIQVQGKVEHLKEDRVASQIRALLLAGIRSAVLWYQLGGRRWRLLLYRKRIHESAGNIRRKLLSTV